MKVIKKSFQVAVLSCTVLPLVLWLAEIRHEEKKNYSLPVAGLISIPAHADLSVYLETSAGRIESDFRLKKREKEEGERMEGEIGKGGARLQVWAQEGSIMLDAQKTSGR